MLMSKSRLEKFLYALYSLDSSDLPTPLSRIEELYNCWVTGADIPTFEPLSRVEKYLMAILGVYDVDSIPNPISRVEVLLYKLATGDDNLDDVKSFLSEHEELLAEIIRNGGAGGNINIEYVLYTLSTKFNTLYNTAEKPVKSAVLKGNTLVNMVKKQDFVENSLQTTSSLYTLDVPVKLNTTYTVYISLNAAYKIKPAIEGVFRVKKNNNAGEDLTEQLRFDKSDVSSSIELKTTIENTDCNYFHFRIYNLIMEKVIVVLLEGDHTEDITSEDMQSVKMPVLTTTGKNLFDIEKVANINNWVCNKTSSTNPYHYYEFSLKPNTTYTFSRKSDVRADGIYASFNTVYGVYYEGGGLIHPSNNSANKSTVSFTTDSNGKIFLNVYNIKSYLSTFISLIEEAQIEEGSTATPYEPYKSTTVTCNEEVELRGIGDVKDESDLLTGELTQRVGEVVLDGSQDGGYDHASNESTGILTLRLPKIPDIINTSANVYGLLSDKYASETSRSPDNILSYNGRIMITKPISELESFNTADKIKSFLSQDPITLQYPLATPVIKTVDLSVVDQDGNNTELSTFDDLTHVILSSEGVIPEAELEVATKNEEVLNTMSLELDDISATQTTLEETSNTQSENVDATMLATTEIYEQLL